MRWPIIVCLLATPLWNVCAHALLCRLPLTKECAPQKLTLLAIATSLALLLGAAFFVVPFSLSAWGFILTLSLGLSHVYFHLFNMSETARRIKILVRMEKGGLETEQEGGGYSARDLVRIRLERLRHLGQIEERNGKYFAKRSLLAVAALAIRRHESWLFPERF